MRIVKGFWVRLEMMRRAWILEDVSAEMKAARMEEAGDVAGEGYYRGSWKHSLLPLYCFPFCSSFFFYVFVKRWE